MDRVYEFLGPSRLSTTSRNLANLNRMENEGMPEFSHHPCESAAPTSDDHNFLIRTPICVFLDSTERSLSLEFREDEVLSQTMGWFMDSWGTV